MRASYAMVVLLGLIACSSPERKEDPVEPVVMVGITNVSPSELERVTDYFESELPEGWRLLEEARIVEASAPRTGDPLVRKWTVELPKWEDLETLHRALCSLQDGETEHRILTSIQTDAILYYTSSRAETDSAASVTIHVSPAKADLYFDTPLPEGFGLSPDEPVPTSNGRFKFRPTFRYIRQHAFLYFHSVYEGQYRYYAYDMESESQKTLQGIRTPEQFKDWLESQ